MARQRVGGPKTFVDVKGASKGDVLFEGHYESSYTGQYGPNYVFREEERGEVVMGGYGHFKYCMEQCGIQVGDYVECIYNGKEKLEKGSWKGSMAHVFEVYKDPEKSLNSPVKVEDDADIDEFGDL
jgi:hypothetical protein